MKITTTRILGMLLCALGLSRPLLAQVTYVTAPVTGFTQDVIANGTGTVMSVTTSDMDNGAVNNRFNYVAPDYRLTATSTLPVSALPAAGPGGFATLTSPVTSGLSFQLASYSANNSLRITTAGTPPGLLTLNTPTAAGYVYLLGASGNGASTFTATVNFTDGTSQAFTGRTFADWFGGTNPVAQGLGRVNYDSNVLQGGTTEPRIYQVELSLLATNYAKPIQSIAIAKTSALGALNVMGVSLGIVCPGAPVGGTAAASASSVCPATSVTLSLNGASSGASIGYQWQASINGGNTWVNIAGANAATFTTTPAVTTQYRAQLTCGTFTVNSTPVTVTVVPTDVVALAYASATACRVGSSAAPTASPAGGTFSSTAGLVIDASTGVVDLAASTVGAYVITYASAGQCSSRATFRLTINPVDVAAVAYSRATYCQSATGVAPVASPTGGSFAGTPGLVLNTRTGVVDFAASRPGQHTVTYTSAGQCPGQATATFTINALDVTTVAYAAASYCQSGLAPAPTVSPGGGTFAGTPGLLLNARTGVIDLTNSTAGLHTVTYTSAGPCPTTNTAQLTVVPFTRTTIALSSPQYCQAAITATPVVTPGGGAYTGSAGLVFNAAGVIDLRASRPGPHILTYTTPGPCGAQATASLNVLPTAVIDFPNVMTPNGDRRNDSLSFHLPPVDDYELQVYNRWGRQVWQSRDQHRAWNAEESSAGIYYYWVQFTDCSGQRQQHRSWVEVIK